MAGYRPWMAGAAGAAKRANAAAAARHREHQRAEYEEHRAEQRACGYEVASFEEWLGEADPKVAAHARVMQGMEYAQWHHAADQF